METNVWWRHVHNFLQYRLDLHEDQEAPEATIEAIRRNIVFKGTNLWTLIFAVFVASIGLNVNSTAVIIGAMLISPLMGPIMGIGFGTAIFDFDLIKKATQNLAIMVAFSLASSTLYFLITPLSEARSELLARTSPSIWDVLIAFFGGLAGIVGITRKEKTNVLAGVAIATALMPPLCTAGYGLATGQWPYFLGAFYLFFINAVFIAYSTIIVVRVLKFPQTSFVSAKVQHEVQRNISAMVLLTVLPSIVLAYNIVHQEIFNRKVQRFVREEFNYRNTQLLKTESTYKRGGCTIRLYTVGASLDSNTIDQMESRLAAYGLNGSHLEIKQGITTQQNIDVTSLRTGILEDLYRRNEEALLQKEQQIHLLQSQLDRYHQFESDAEAIATELKALQPAVQQFSINSNIYFDFAKQKNDTLPLAYLHASRRISPTEQSRIFEWLKVRTASHHLILVQK